MTQTDNGDDLAAIHALIERRGDAVRARKVSDLFAQAAPENVSFDVVDPLQYLGAEQTRRRAEEWLGTFDGPIGYETRDLQVAAAGNVGFAHCLTRLSGTTANGALNMWIRSTTCFRKFDGQWQIVHEHNSVPFDPMTGKASLGLEP
jgi:ketosteroid isomerase-like protein